MKKYQLFLLLILFSYSGCKSEKDTFVILKNSEMLYYELSIAVQQYQHKYELDPISINDIIEYYKSIDEKKKYYNWWKYFEDFLRIKKDC